MYLPRGELRFIVYLLQGLPISGILANFHVKNIGKIGSCCQKIGAS